MRKRARSEACSRWERDGKDTSETGHFVGVFVRFLSRDMVAR